MEKIAKLLKETREDKDLSQRDVMEQTGISNKSLSRYENNVTEPDIETLATLCRLYGISLDAVLGLPSESQTKLALSSDEVQWIRKWRALSPTLKDALSVELDALYQSETPSN